MTKQQYRENLLAASLAVTRKRGNYTGHVQDIDVDGQVVSQYDTSKTTRSDISDDILKAALPEPLAFAMTNIAKNACELLVKVKGRALTPEEVRDVVHSLV
ncbi:hypothetical protein [Pseudomonas sp.]|uniref:hypothetical protein n=1 Tax=Pseudomonas sp. TaxID=306 RepID=UPI002FC86105